MKRPPEQWEKIFAKLLSFKSFPGASDGKASAYNAGDPGSIPGLGRSPGEGNGNPRQYSCLENPMDGGAWLAAVHRVTKSRKRLNDFTSTLSDKGLVFKTYQKLKQLRAKNKDIFPKKKYKRSIGT